MDSKKEFEIEKYLDFFQELMAVQRRFPNNLSITCSRDEESAEYTLAFMSGNLILTDTIFVGLPNYESSSPIEALKHLEKFATKIEAVRQ